MQEKFTVMAFRVSDWCPWDPLSFGTTSSALLPCSGTASGLASSNFGVVAATDGVSGLAGDFTSVRHGVATGTASSSFGASGFEESLKKNIYMGNTRSIRSLNLTTAVMTLSSILCMMKQDQTEEWQCTCMAVISSSEA